MVEFFESGESSRSKGTGESGERSQGLPDRQHFFSRDKIIEKIGEAFDDGENAFLLSAPPASGKTSVLQILQLKKDIGKTIKDPLYIEIEMDPSVDPFALLSSFGMQYSPGQGWRIPEEWKKSKDGKDRFVVILLDDAQLSYDNERFWWSLLKEKGDPNVKFIFAATYSLIKGGTPASLAGTPRVVLNDFKLSDAEAMDYLRHGNPYF